MAKYPQLTDKKCHRCGQFLMLMEVRVEDVPGQHGKVTTSIFKCSDNACQKRADGEMSRMIKKKNDQEEVRAKRLQDKKDERVKKTLDSAS